MMNILDPKTLSFERNPNGYLDMDVEGKTYCNVRCMQLFPLSDPRRYIAVFHKPVPHTEEIGIIMDLNGLSSSSYDLLKSEISIGYFVPEILSIQSIEKTKSAHSMETWTVETDRGGKTFQLASPKENVTVSGKGAVFIIDIEKCGYKITDYQALPIVSRAKMEKYFL
jgi:hypothetical protein